MKLNPTVSIVIPCYNEKFNLVELLPLIYTILKDYDFYLVYEIILVDDGSVDDTFYYLYDYLLHHPVLNNIVYIKLIRNFGHQAAISCGFNNFNSDVCIVMDADFQDPPELLPEMLDMWHKKYKFVQTERVSEILNNKIKQIFSNLYYPTFSILTGIEMPKSNDFCLYDKSVIEFFNSVSHHSIFFRGLRIWAGFKYGTVKFHRPERKHGKPSYTFLKIIKLAVISIIDFGNVAKIIILVQLSSIILIVLLYLLGIYLNSIILFMFIGFQALLNLIVHYFNIRIMFKALPTYIIDFIYLPSNKQ